MCFDLPSTARVEAVCLGLVFSSNQTHELGHDVAVIIGWPEAMVGDCPARWEDDKVSDRCAGRVRFAGENSENGWVLEKSERRTII